MSSSPSYKNFNIDNFLSIFYKSFPSVQALGVQPVNVEMNVPNSDGMILNPMIDNSRDFCDLLQNSTLLRIPIGGGAPVQGGFGVVTKLTILEDEIPNRQPVMGILVSIKKNGIIQPFYVPIVIKTGHQRLPDQFYQYRHILVGGINIELLQFLDPVSEFIFGSMTGYLYDMGVCPFFIKYLGVAICNEPGGRPRANVINEASSIELRKLLTRPSSPGSFDYLSILNNDSSIFMNILFQVVWALYIGKQHLGLCHLDLHHRNVMVTVTNRSLGFPDKPIEYIYNGEHLNKKQFFLFKSDSTIGGRPLCIAIKNRGLLAKIIDYGVAISHMHDVRHPSSNNNKLLVQAKSSHGYIFSTQTRGGFFMTENIEDTTAHDDNSRSRRNTVDIQYLMSNIYLHMTKLLDRRSGQPPTPGNDETTDFLGDPSYNNLVDTLNEFYSHFYPQANSGEARGSIRDFINSKLPDRSYDIQREGYPPAHPYLIRWISRNRRTGVVVPEFHNPNELMNGLARYCLFIHGGQLIQKRFQFSHGQEDVSICFLEPDIFGMDLTTENCLVLTSDFPVQTKQLRRINNYLEAEQQYRDNCQNVGALDTISPDCNALLQRKRKWDPERVHKKSFVSRFSQSAGYDKHSGEFDMINDILDTNTLSVSSSTNSVEIYNLQINPKALKMNPNSEGSFFYRSYQQWFDAKTIDPKKDGTPFELVNINVISLQLGSNINLNLNADLWTSSQNPDFANARSAVIVNGGYFVVPQNLNTLTNITLGSLGILDATGNLLMDRLKPIGFFYKAGNLGSASPSGLDPTNGTHLPIPKAYSPYFAVIYQESASGNIVIKRHNEFIRAHNTLDVTCGYILDDGTYYITTQKVIRMRNGNRLSIHNPPDLIPGNTENVLPYNWAFCTGPIYIYENNFEFDIQTLTGKQFIIDDSDVPADAILYQQVQARLMADPQAQIDIPDPANQIMRNKPPNFTTYRIDPYAKNNFMFKYSDENDSYGFPMRNSNRLVSHSILGYKNGRLYVIFVEGRGYDAPGLERSQVSHLCKNLEMEYAVSLDGGFSGDAIYKIDGGNRKYLQNYPERRPLGLSLTFSYP